MLISIRTVVVVFPTDVVMERALTELIPTGAAIVANRRTLIMEDHVFLDLKDELSHVQTYWRWIEFRTETLEEVQND